MKRIVFATNNAHKLDEMRKIVGDNYEIISLAELGCHEDIPETADTLEGNAVMKAQWVHDHYGVDCFSGDTGLEIDALDGRPGVHSARYATDGHDSEANINKVLGELQGVENRSAHFTTVIALIMGGELHTFKGQVFGRILTERHGTGGFGYDSIFLPDESDGRTFAQMDADEKGAISHRGRATRALVAFLSTLK